MIKRKMSKTVELIQISFIAKSSYRELTWSDKDVFMLMLMSV